MCEDCEMMTRGADVDELEDCLSYLWRWRREPWPEPAEDRHEGRQDENQFEDEPLSQGGENGYEFADRGILRCVAGVGAFVRFWPPGRAGVVRPRRVPTF
mmetsp:Transcript_13620/g.36556  ORF Transcript_13620/g.36556 Transcript_13620/m.36556 type:complete len:100 (+) Transcript_13620:385-684(+)